MSRIKSMLTIHYHMKNEIFYTITIYFYQFKQTHTISFQKKLLINQFL